MTKKQDSYEQSTESLQRNLHEGRDLDAFIYHNVSIFDQNNFHGQLVLLQCNSPYDIKDIIEGTYIDASYCYQIFRGTRMPSRNNIPQICKFLQLNLTDLNRLLKLAGHSPLYIKRLRDTVIIHAFMQDHSLDELEEALLDRDCEGLCDR